MNRTLPSLFSAAKFLPVLVCLLLAQHLVAQENLNNFNHISTSDRFSLNSVTAISQDSKGFMWFGTRNGLVRYDGNELKFIKRDFKTEALFDYNDINGIHIDSRGDIWMATSYGLSVYNPRLDSIRNFPSNGPRGTCTTSNVITGVREMASGEVWVGTNNGLCIYNPKKNTFQQVLHEPSNKKGLSSNTITCLYQTADASIWVGTDKGLHKLLASQEGQPQFALFQHDPENPGSIANNEVNVLLEDKNGNFWVGTRNGLDNLDVKQNEFVHFSKQKGNRMTSEFIRAMTIDKKDRLWVGTYDGITLIESGQVVRLIKHDPNLPASLVDNKIRALFTDNNGSVWIGSYYGGINYWDERQLNFAKIDEGNGHKLSFKVVSTIAQDQDGHIYFGTEGEGISILNAKTNSYQHINRISDDLKIGAIKTLFLDGKSDLWIGTYNTGLLHLNTKTNGFRHYKNNPRNEQSISSDKVLSIARSADKFWVGTLDNGLNLLDPATGTFTRISSQPNDDKTIHSNSVRNLLLDKKGDLYVGTSQGLSVLRSASSQPATGYKFTRLSAGLEHAANLNILDLYEDEQGQVWVGTINYGMFRVEKNKLVPVNLKRGISVYSILQDENKIFWLSSSEGIIRYDAKLEAVKVYNSREGVQSNEFSRTSKLFAKDGKIYFGGASGVTTFRPEEMGGINDYAPDVVLTRFSLFDKALEVGDSTGILSSAIEETRFIKLDYDQNIFTINFAMPNFISNGNNKYQYRLKGLDDKWTTTSTPFVTYTIQRGGDYVFEVRGENSNGYQTAGVTSLNIEVLSPPWRTWWAYLAYSLFILGAFYAFVHIYLSRITLQHKLDLETREFLHQQEVNKQKLQFFTNVSHEFRTPLTLISGPLQKLIEDYKGPHKLFRQLLVIKKNTDQLFKLINELLDFRKFEDKQMRLQAAEGNIVKFMQEIYLSFQQQAKFNKYTYTFEAESEDMQVYYDRDKLEKVFYNLLANAFKYTPRKGTIAVKLKCTNSHVEIKVQDDGNGMEAGQLDKIFNRFYEIPDQKSHGSFQHGTGIGLSIVKSVVELHKGDIAVESEPGKGSSFTVSLPLGRAHLMNDEVIAQFRDSEDVMQYNQLPLPETEAEMEQENNFAMPEDVGKKCVLVVEDNPELGSFIRTVLADTYRVILVENGLLGYQNAIQNQPDLIITDLMMPVMDGIELCSKVKSDIRTSHIPVIMLSARTSLVYKYDGLESGADEYLNKPFEIKELLLKCKNILNTHDRIKEKFQSSGVFGPSEIAVNSLDETMMNKAFLIVKENVSNEFFGVEQFCEELGISRSLLFTKFKAWTNQTPNEFILNIRMKQAAHLIEKNSHSLSEIGYKVGFKDPSYFSKVFKKHFAVTPKAYAEKFRQDFTVA